MATTLAPEVLSDELAVTVARVLAAANRQAEASGVILPDSIVSISEEIVENSPIWRVNYGPRDFVNRRGGDLIVEVDATTAEVKRVLRGQ